MADPVTPYGTALCTPIRDGIFRIEQPGCKEPPEPLRSHVALMVKIQDLAAVMVKATVADANVQLLRSTSRFMNDALNAIRRLK